jgi:NAD(P)-dependent dehydrogenase (short-subunit alcohol dehydrogenase family)
MSFNPIALHNKSFLISGAGSGLGRATSVLLSKLGAKLLLVDINETGLNETKILCESETKTVVLDLLDNQNIKDKVAEAVTSFGKLNGFVHSAGMPYISPLKSISTKKCNDVFMLNTFAGLELAKVCTSKNIFAQENGSIVFISSVYGLVGSAANVGYAMSKAALHGVTKSLAIELAPKNIRVNCVAPGFVKTKMFDEISDSFNSDYHKTLNDLHPLGLGEPEDIANTIAFLLSDMAKWITGSIISVDGGFTAQ